MTKSRNLNLARCVIFCCVCIFIVSCGGGSGSSSADFAQNDDSSQSQEITVSGRVLSGGQIIPEVQTVPLLSSATVNLVAEDGFSVGPITGCPGTLNNDTYTTEALDADCVFFVEFVEDGVPIFVDLFGDGRITSDQDTCENDAPCIWHKPDNAEVILQAEPAPGWDLNHWVGCEAATASICTIKASDKHSVTAYFARIGDPVLKPEVVILSDRQLDALADSSEGALIFDNTVAELSQLPIGTILVSTRDVGFARRISQIVAVPNGFIIIQTRQAAAEDIVEFGTLLWSSARLDSRSIKFKPSANNRAAVSSYTGLSPKFAVDLLLYTGTDPISGLDAEVKLTGDVELILAIDYALDFGFEGINEIKLASTINVKPSLELSVGAVMDIPLLDQKIPLGTFILPPVAVGPIVLISEVETFISLDAKVGGEISLESHITIGGVSGFHYRKGDGWSFPNDLSLSHDFFDVTASPLNAKATLWLNEQATVKLWNLAGPKLKVGPVVAANLSYSTPNFPENFDGCLSANAYLGGKVELTGEIGFHSWTLTVPKFTLNLDYIKLYEDKDLLNSQTCSHDLLPAPENLTATIERSNLNLSWDPPPSNFVSDYLVYRDGEFHDRAFGFRYNDEVSHSGVRVCYEVFAIDQVGRLSPASNEACVISDEQSPQFPAQPINVIATNLTSNSVQLNWQDQSSNSELSYLIYDSNSNFVHERVQDSGILLNRLQSNSEYCFSVVAINDNGDLSESSDEVCVRTRPIREGSWQVSLRCEESTEYAFNAPIDIGASRNGLVSTVGSARDYFDGEVGAGNEFGYIISGYFDPASEVLEGAISFTFESGGYRQDEFEADLSTNDSGDVSATLIEHTSSGCAVWLRFRRVDLTTNSKRLTKLVQPVPGIQSFESQVFSELH